MSKAQSEARLKMLREPGHLYAAYSRYCDWIKIGFTSKPVEDRLEGIFHQYAEFAPFSLIGSVRSTHAAEQQIHDCFAYFRRNHTGRTRELYPALPALVRQVKAIMTYREWELMSFGRKEQVKRACRLLAAEPLARVEAEITYDRYYAERRAA